MIKPDLNMYTFQFQGLWLFFQKNSQKHIIETKSWNWVWDSFPFFHRFKLLGNWILYLLFFLKKSFNLSLLSSFSFFLLPFFFFFVVNLLWFFFSCCSESLYSFFSSSLFLQLNSFSHIHRRYKVSPIQRCKSPSPSPTLHSAYSHSRWEFVSRTGVL